MLTIFNLFYLIAVLTSTSAVPFNSKCGKFNIAEIVESENYQLKYRNQGNSVIASAIECQEYEEHLKSEAIAIKETILMLQERYDKKIQEVIKMRKGQLRSKKNLASSYSCDPLTGLWRQNREAMFKCSINKRERLAELAVQASDQEANMEISEIDYFLLPKADSYSSLVEPLVTESDHRNDSIVPTDSTTTSTDPKCNQDHSSPINIETAETQKAQGVYVNNMDLIYDFLKESVNNRNFTGYLAKSKESSRQDYQPLTYKFDEPIEYQESSVDMKCDHLNFHLKGSEHSVDGQLYDGEVQLYCWIASKAETFDEALELSKNGDDSIIKAFSYFINKGSSNTEYNHLIGAVLNGGSNLIQDGQDEYELQLETDLPVVGDYFGYTGSMTDSSCGATIQWTVFKQPIDVNPKQLSVIDTDLWEHAGVLTTTRPVENSSNRVVRSYSR